MNQGSITVQGLENAHPLWVFHTYTCSQIGLLCLFVFNAVYRRACEGLVPYDGGNGIMLAYLHQLSGPILTRGSLCHSAVVTIRSTDFTIDTCVSVTKMTTHHHPPY